MDLSVFFAEVMQYINSFGGLSSMMKIAGVVTLLLSSLKVSAIKSILWDKLGAYKALAAPLLGLLAGLFSVQAVEGQSYWAGVLAWVLSTSGAIIFHEILDALKQLPGIGATALKIEAMLNSVYEVLKKLLGAA